MKKRGLILIITLLGFITSCLNAQYHIYGTAGAGGSNGDGIIFGYDPLTNKDSVLFSFNGTNGLFPESNFLLASDGLLYSLTEVGGAYNMGTIFSFNPKTSVETVLVSLDSINGEIVHGGNDLIQGKNGELYGTVFQGGTYNAGVIFSYNISAQKDSALFNLGTDTAIWPCRSLYQDTATGLLYGITEAGGKGYGVLYKFNPNTCIDSNLFEFTMTGNEPVGSLSGVMRASNGLLYSMALEGGDSNYGAIFSYNINTRMLKTEFSFKGLNGRYPRGNNLIQLPNGMMFGMTTNGGRKNDGVLFEFNPTNDSERVLVNFNDTNGSTPYGDMLWDTYNNLLYGVTSEGGSSNYGVFFSYDTVTSTYTKIFDFTGTNGESPISSLIIVPDSEDITTGIAKINKDNVLIFPNPSSGIFTLTFTGASARMNRSDGQNPVPATIEVYNVLGEKVYSQFTTHNSPFTIDLNQPGGIYFYRIISESGTLIGEGKVIVQR